MKCPELLRALNEYIEGEIDPAVCEELEKHLAGCNPCKVVIDNIRKTISLYKNDKVYELPLDFKQRLHQALKDKWKKEGNPPSDKLSGQER
jgi:RNA polymerase sigma-70 factor (ECF subfamily)